MMRYALAMCMVVEAFSKIITMLCVILQLYVCNTAFPLCFIYIINFRYVAFVKTRIYCN